MKGNNYILVGVMMYRRVLRAAYFGIYGIRDKGKWYNNYWSNFQKKYKNLFFSFYRCFVYKRIHHCLVKIYYWYCQIYESIENNMLTVWLWQLSTHGLSNIVYVFTEEINVINGDIGQKTKSNSYVLLL